jgi:hypothetical protein
MAKLTLNGNPTFKAKVGIPVPGSEPVDVEFEFKHKTRTEFAAYISAARLPEDAPEVTIDNLETVTAESIKRDAKRIMEIAVGWELDDPFTTESVESFINKYDGSSPEIMATYGRELQQAKRKNS